MAKIIKKSTETIAYTTKCHCQFQYVGVVMLVALLMSLFLPITYSSESKENPLDFNRDIRPILSENCFACHGPDAKQRQADLRLDTKAGAFSSPNGYPVIIPGNPEESELYLRITSDDTGYRMPPEAFGKTLTAQQIKSLNRWIKDGAEWQEHWAFVPPTHPKPPKVKKQGWVRNAIDNFILARLEAEGLRPSEPVDKRTLIRRVSLDLIGLPSTRAEIKEFLTDDSPDAYEKLVDRLLAKPQYGEHIGRFWLDVARYGDTHGLHLDNYREMWVYRDWVIDAFNKNMPFDQFTIEQLAGDLFPEPTLQQRIATGFNRCHVTTSEGGSIDEEYYVRYAVDRASTTATVWMGLTVGCATCHDHKYDPITQKEFYQLYAYFNNITESAMDGNRKDPPPVIKVPTPEQKAQLSEFDKQITALDVLRKRPLPAVDTAQSAWEHSFPEWLTVEPKEFTAQGGTTLELLADKSILASGENPEKEVYQVVAEIAEGKYTALRLEGLRDKSLPKEGAGRSNNSNVVLTGFEAEVASADEPGTWQPIRFIRAWADYEQPGNFAVANVIDENPETGWGTEGDKRLEDRQAIFWAETPFGDAEKNVQLKIRIKHESQHKRHQFGRIRLSVTKAEAIYRTGSQVTLGEWASLGPFQAYHGDWAFTYAYEPEGKPVNTKQEFKFGDKTLKWTNQPQWTDGMVHNLNRLVTENETIQLTGEHCATYLYRNVRSHTKQNVTLFLGSNDAIKVWVNRKAVLSQDIERDAAPNQEKIEVELNAGNNEIVMKVVNYTGAYGFFFKLKSAPAIQPVDVLDIVKIDREGRTGEQKNRIRDHFRNTISTDPELRKFQVEMADIRKKREDLDRQVTTTLVMAEREEPRGAYVLARGQYTQPGEQVHPMTPAVLSPMPKEASKNRLGLARWLVDPAHPLTARVTVNRFWQNIFGTGIVKTAEDFGSQGERPRHPELLDWLATELIRSGWDIKYMMKLMVTSATYRQTARVTPELLKRDPDNRLLARGPRFRLDAEMMRDQVLTVSGLLNSKIGGPSVKPPQPDGLWYAVGYTGSNTVRFKKDEGAEKVYRRTVYTFLKRTAPPPQMAIFDAPSRESCTMRRERTNTPLQALMLMNDPQYFESARAFAERTLKEGGTTPEERIAYAFETATARLPDAKEVAILLSTFQGHLEEFQASPDAAKKLITIGESPPDKDLEPVELAAWTMITNLILNLDEVINKG